MTNLVNLLDHVISLTEAAADLLVKEWEREGGPRGQGDKADVDRDIEVFLRSGLLRLLDADFWGEETSQYLTRNPYCWVVDPHDGTADFLRGLQGSSVSVALVHNNIPVLGVVCAPISPDRGRDCIAWAEGLPHLLRNGHPLQVDLSLGELSKDSIVWLSAAAANKPEINTELCFPSRFIAMPSIAYRLARAAIGDGVCAVSLVSLAAHDVAAGHALLRGAGGVLLRQDGKPLSYAHSFELVSLRCFGGAPLACEALTKRLWGEALKSPVTLQRSVNVRACFPSVANMQRGTACLAGLIAGDNLGAQVEFMDAQSVDERCRIKPLCMEDGGVWNILAGQPTDDGELALTLARSIVVSNGYNSESAAQAYVQWLASKPFDIGNTTRQALIGPMRYPHLPVAEACRVSASISSQANGALMRVAPIGIAAQGNPQLAANWARQDAQLTHPHPVCVEANAAFSAAIAVGVAGGGRQEMFDSALAQLADDDHANVIRNCLLAAAKGEVVEEFQWQMGWVLIALQNAFYRLMLGASIEDAVVDTVMCGGDTDTNASIVGALIGAATGLNVFPLKWALCLRSNRALLGVKARPAFLWPDDVSELAERLSFGCRQEK